MALYPSSLRLLQLPSPMLPEIIGESTPAHHLSLRIHLRALQLADGPLECRISPLDTGTKYLNRLHQPLTHLLALPWCAEYFFMSSTPFALRSTPLVLHANTGTALHMTLTHFFPQMNSRGCLGATLSPATSHLKMAERLVVYKQQASHLLGPSRT